MTDPPPASTRTPTSRTDRWWRLGGLTLDAILLTLVVQSWNLPVLQLAQGLFGGAPAAEGVQFGSRGFNLLGVEGEVLGLAFTALVVAIQIPFLLRSSTLGMTFCGVEMRLGEDRAPAGRSVPWALLAWLLSLLGAYGLVVLFASLAPGAGLLAVLGVALVSVPVVNLIVGIQTGASMLDRLMGLTLGGRGATVPTTDHLGGWKPRANPPKVWSSTVDDDAKLWRAHSTADPLGPFLGPAVAPMPEAPLEPEHAEFMSADDPFAAVGGVVEADPDEQALVERLRRASEAT